MKYWKDGIVSIGEVLMERIHRFFSKMDLTSRIKARFAIADWVRPAEFPAEFDLHINNGRMLEHFHEGI